MSSDAGSYALLNGQDEKKLNYKELYRKQWEEMIQSNCPARKVGLISGLNMCNISYDLCDFGEKGEKCFVIFSKL